MPRQPRRAATAAGPTTTGPAARRLAALRRGSRRQRAEADAERPARSSAAPPGTPGWARLRHALAHPGRGQLVAAALLFVLGLAGVAQVRATSADDTYTSARREDLVQLLDGLGSESQRLESEIAELERTRAELQSGADTSRVAREEAETRAGQLAILAGTAPAAGPGIRLRIDDPQGKVTADLLLDTVEEMRDAGAEVIEVNDSIRVVASTWFGADARGLVVDGRAVSRPVTLEVIGDPQTLEEAARFRGGIVSEITGAAIGGQVQIQQLDRLVVDSLHAAPQNQYAQRSSGQPTPR